MNNIDIAKGMIFQKLHISKENFDDRLICQKKIYLLQQLDVDLGYSYNWYIHGPYSPALTSYIYSNIEALSNYDFSNYKLSQKVLDGIEKVNSINNEKPDELNSASWYELLASLEYIGKNSTRWKIKNELDLFDTLIKYKPQFDKKECEAALESLINNEFIEGKESYVNKQA